VPDAVVAVATAGTGALATRGAKGTMDIIDGLSDLRHLDDLGDLRHLDDLGDLRRLDAMPDDLRTLVDKPVGDLTPSEIERLTEARNAIRIEPGTPLQRVISDNVYDDYLRGSSTTNPRFSPDQSFGFTARAEDVAHLRTPREMCDDLGLGYKDTEFSPDQDEIKVLRYSAEGPDDFNIPRHSDLGGDGTWDKGALDPTDPFTGNGYTSGGIPEFRNVSPSDINIGDQIWSYDKFGNQHLVAEYGPDGWLAVPR
jgi:hypothetical protein